MAEQDTGSCQRGPAWFRCIYETEHDDDCFGYRVVPQRETPAPPREPATMEDVFDLVDWDEAGSDGGEKS